MRTLSLDIRELLELHTLLSFGQDLFIGKEPSGVGAFVTLYDTGGIEQNPAYQENEETCQVRVKGDSYESTSERAVSLTSVLQGIGRTTVDEGDTRVEGIWLQSPISFLERNNNEEAVFTFNIRVLRRAITSQEQNRILL